jgi:hypothetical protein
MQDSPERLQRLYDQLIPFGTLCNVALTDEHLTKLAPRSTPADEAGTGPSTSRYRVVLIKETKLKVSVVRHITVSTARQHEILTRTTGPFWTTRKGNTKFVPTTVRTVQVNTVEPLPLTVPSMPSLSHFDAPPVCSTIHGSQPSTPDGKRGKGSSQYAPGSGDSADQANRRSICGKVKSTLAFHLQELDGGRSCGKGTVAHSPFCQAEEGTPGDCDRPLPHPQPRPRGERKYTEQRQRQLGGSGVRSGA